MGLDQYAYFRTLSNVAQVDWRKHAALQEFMERLWQERTGKPREDLNCDELELTKDDIQALRQAVLSGFKDCQSEGGCFYGHQFQEETIKDNYESDLRFCDEALAAIHRGDQVFYSCWY